MRRQLLTKGSSRSISSSYSVSEPELRSEACSCPLITLPRSFLQPPVPVRVENTSTSSSVSDSVTDSSYSDHCISTQRPEVSLHAYLLSSRASALTASLPCEVLFVTFGSQAGFEGSSSATSSSSSSCVTLPSSFSDVSESLAPRRDAGNTAKDNISEPVHGTWAGKSHRIRRPEKERYESLESKSMMITLQEANETRLHQLLRLQPVCSGDCVWTWLRHRSWLYAFFHRCTERC